MFYCPECQRKNGWPETMTRSAGPCEVCGQTDVCYDAPSHDLPLPSARTEGPS